MRIEKMYYTLSEILRRWSISEDDLVYLAENDKLCVSVQVYDLPVEFGDYEKGEDGEWFRVPFESAPYSGLLDLHASDVYQLFRCGELQVGQFRTPRASYADLFDGVPPVLVIIGDLMLRRDERDRFEVETGFSSGGQVNEDQTFIAAADYQEVRCNGHRFKLGPIQAEVVRALHQAAQAGEPWQNGKAILSQAGSRSLRMADVFKSQTNWRQLIRSDRRGGYRLNLD